jgi:predicted HAD superfamily Cof-like phosphohydrolase
MVTEFHRLNGAVINGKNNGLNVAVLRARLMMEELAETVIALHKNDVAEAADGLADLLYVIYGTAASYGVPCGDAFMEPKHTPVAMFSRAAVLSFVVTTLPRLWFACSLLEEPTGEDLGPALRALAGEVCAFAAAWGLPMRELFEEVHRSNLTKTFAPAAIAPGDKYGVINSKGPGYRPPDIVGVLNQARRAFIQA